MSHYEEQYEQWDNEIHKSRELSSKIEWGDNKPIEDKSLEVKRFLDIQRVKVENLARQQQEIIDITTAALNISIKDKEFSAKLEDLIFDYLHNTSEDDGRYSNYIVGRIVELLNIDE